MSLLVGLGLANAQQAQPSKATSAMPPQKMEKKVKAEKNKKEAAAKSEMKKTEAKATEVKKTDVKKMETKKIKAQIHKKILSKDKTTKIHMGVKATELKKYVFSAKLF